MDAKYENPNNIDFIPLFMQRFKPNASLKLNFKKPNKEVSYVKDPVLNKVLNETAQKEGMEDYPTMGGETYDTSKMAELMGYGSQFGNPEMKRQSIGVTTAQAAGVNPDSVPEDVMKALTKDYSGVMKALDKKDGKI